MLFDDLIARNQAFVRGRGKEPFPAPESKRLAVVACYDPRLDALLQSALGLQDGEAFLLRTAGALVQPQGGVMRSLAMAIFMFGCTEVLVVGHKACRMATFDASGFIDLFRRRGVQRDAFGNDDLRSWAGAIPSPRAGVDASVRNILSAPFLPKDVTVSGVVLDEETGALEVIVRPGTAPGSGVTSAPPARTESEERTLADLETTKPSPPPTVPPPVPTPAPQSADPLDAAIDGFVQVLRQAAGGKAELVKLRHQIEAQPTAMQRIRAIEEIAMRSGPQATQIAAAFSRLKRELITSGLATQPKELAIVLARLLAKL